MYLYEVAKQNRSDSTVTQESYATQCVDFEVVEENN